MQEGNLKTKKLKRVKPQKKWFEKLNPMLYMPWTLYKDFLDAYIGFHGIETYYYYHRYPKIIEHSFLSALKIKELPKDTANTQMIPLDSMKKLSYSLDYRTKGVKVLSGLDFKHKVKWVLLNFKKLVRTKAENIKLLRKPQIRTCKNFDIKNRIRKKELDKTLFTINNFVNSKEELIDLLPYLKDISLTELYNLPIEKDPMNKNFLELALLEKFKQKLSETAKVKPAETKVINVYENLQIELYKDIKHNSKTNKLMCYLDQNKRHIQTPKNFYLVFGQRLADKKMFTIVCEK
ncbi:MAG: hypothetical protein PHE78_02895 [Candidatus Gastranaerophilales bacterium]|nr:hypothetical protein [Candidatus Gastranaerophilales bacterium]